MNLHIANWTKLAGFKIPNDTGFTKRMETFNYGCGIDQIPPTQHTDQMGVEGGVDFHASFTVHVSSLSPPFPLDRSLVLSTNSLPI